ncbi:MAG: DUF349 domain-containing protein [Brachymonas sp.]|nr:DUF349 domain-containing protein [Brachymonas sp.]
MIRIPFLGDSHDDASQSAANPAPSRPAAAEHPLDALTGGVFSAATSGERAAKVRAWLATNPDPAALQEVYKELSQRDKGAAKALREKLDDIKRSKGQEALAGEWAARAEALLQASRFHIADAMAWQRDAAKAGAPLSREPLQTLKAQLAERIQQIEDLHTRAQVQREAAALLAQRIELLSTKSWRQADAVQGSLHADVQHWHTQTRQLQQDAHWPHVDARYTQPLDAARQQLDLVAQAFMAAVEQARAAAADSSQALPPVQVWADELRAARQASAAGTDAAAAAEPGSSDEANAASPADPAAHSARQAEAQSAVQPLLQTLEAELAKGQGKTVAAAAQALRQTLKEHGRFLPAAFEAQLQTTLAKASELEGWQRWRADQLRTELVQKAEALIHRPAPAATTTASTEASDALAASDASSAAATAAATESSASQVVQEAAPNTSAPAATANDAPSQTSAAAAEAAASSASSTADPAASVDSAAAAQTAQDPSTNSAPKGPAKAPAAAGPLPTSPHSPRKLQELLRQLREQWKEVDQGGLPNHALWRRFDQACNEAYRIVQAWLAQMKQQAAAQKALRMNLLGELKTWGEALATRAAQASDIDWKAAQRELSAFNQRWREAGHVSEKVFAELQTQWKAALQQAAQPLHAVQQASLTLRQQLIEQAQALSEGPLRIDAIKELQQRWQQEAQRVPLERRQEQKLWDAFRKPIDLAFQRRSQQRTQMASAASQRDQAVLQAVQALDAATASGDAQAIRQAMQTLEAAMRDQQTAASTAATPDAAPAAASASAADASASQAAAPAEETAAPNAEAAAANADAAVTAEAGATANIEEEASSHAPTETETEAANGSAALEASSDAATDAAPAPVSAAAPRPVVAMRGDDRPGARIAPAAAASNKASARPEREARRPARADSRGDWRSDSRGRLADRPDGKRPPRDDARPRPHTPRLGDAAFRAQRDAVERAQTTLRKLAAQAHGETLLQVLAAWGQRQPDALPPANALGKALGNAQRQQWAQALQGKAAQPRLPASEALLRLEMAADAPTPAEHLEARRALQLQLLTRRNDPAPRETWAEDVAHVLAARYEAAQAKRLQNALRLLLKR